MKSKKILAVCLVLVICLAFFTRYGNFTPSVTADLSYTQADVEMLPISSDVKVVGLGEASHGVAQYQQMKAEVFKTLVKNNGCRTFIIEGDIGSGLKVDRYINGGDGNAEEIVREIGFNIYRTQEMADLLQWMRSYKETIDSYNTSENRGSQTSHGLNYQKLGKELLYLIEALGVMKRPPKVRQSIAEKLFKQPKGLVVCE